MLRCRISKTLFSLFFICFAGLTASAERIADLPQPTNYVSDFAHVLSPETVQAVDQYCLQVDQQAHSQIAVVTVKNLDGADIDDYAIRLWDKWKVGGKSTDRGILILLATDDHKRRITTGYGLEGILPDGKVGDIGRQMVPYLRANDFDSAVVLAVQQVSQVIAADAGVTIQGAPRRGPPQTAVQALSLRQILMFAIVIFFVIALLSRLGGGGMLGFLLGMFLGGGGRGGGWGGGGGDGGGGFGGFGGGSSGGGGASGDW